MEIKIPTKQWISYVVSLILLSLLFSYSMVGQTQAPSVTAGVTFQWADTQANNNDPATLSSITIDSEVFQSFVVPSSYTMTRVGPNGNGPNKILKNGTVENTSSANPDWNAEALASFQDKNLNHYFKSDSNGRDICNEFEDVAGSDTQLQSLYYSPGIPSNDGGIIAITERNANNCYYIAVYGTPEGGGPEEFLGDTFVRANTLQSGPLFNAPPAGVDYWNSGRVLENNGTIGVAIFLLDDLAPVGSTITRVDLLAATPDHGDGKLFILQRYAVPKSEKSCMNVPFNGTVDGSTIPEGSSFSLVGGPTPAGEDFTFNTDGSYTYTPSIGFTGDVVFEYSVCLPAPNATTCDSSTITITYQSGLGTDCECDSGNADGPLLQN